MNERIHASVVFAKRRIFETLISPGFYIALSIGLLAGTYLVTSFIKAVDSSGFNYNLNPFYELIGRSLQGAFGKTFVEQLFCEGPFLFAFCVSFFPILLYMSISSVFRFGLEKKVGAIELLSYGPADGTAYFTALMIKDVLLTLLCILVLVIFLSLAALLNNLILGPMFAYSLLMIFLISFSIYAYGILASTLTDNSASAIALFVGVILFFLIIMMGSFTIVSHYVKNLTGVLSWVIQWLSPFYYMDLGLRALGTGKPLAFLLSQGLLIVLTAVLLFLSHVILRAKGVRA